MRRNKPYPTRIPVGRLELKIPGEIRKFRARLKLYSAEARIIIETIRGERIEINTLIAMNQNILIVKINNKNISVEITPPKYDEETRKRLEEWRYPKPIEGYSSSKVRWLWQRIPRSGHYIIACREKAGRKGKTIVLTIVSNRDSENVKKYALNLLKYAVKNIWNH